MLIREYVSDDYPQLLSLLKTVYQSSIEQNILESVYLGRGKHIFVAVDQDTGFLIGCAFAEVKEDFVRPERIMYVSYVAVAEEYRRHGIGKILLSEIEQCCAKENCTAIELTSADYREGAHAFYHSIGFTRKKTTVFIKELLDAGV